MTKQILLTAATAMALLMPSTGKAQTFYDITEYYIQNAQFSANTDYDRQATGDLKNIANEPTGWTRTSDSNTSFTVAATFEYGTQATFYGAPIPSAGPDGNGGNCLTLCAGLKKTMTFSQKVKLPAGSYQLLVSLYNCNTAAEVGNSTSGWFISSTDNTLSTMEAFPAGQWLTDTIAFTLTEATEGFIRLGFKSAGSNTPMSAMLAVDRVRLMRDTPYGDTDVTGEEPVVVTDTRFARGATMAFGRIKKATVTGGTIAERGFCWSESPNPTVADNKVSEGVEHSGPIYILRNLKPSTKYYMRAYARSDGKRVGYGDVIKFYTLPKGNITYWYNNGGDAAANTRVNAAATEACDIFSNLSEMVKHFSIGYSAGTPTADCYYGDEPWMNMGANSSYQRTGTIMHEMQHGLGVIPYTTHWAGNILRSGNGTGQWLGDRVSAFLDFWDNTTGSRLNGDTQHMWPYGINGASEDHGNIMDYYANAMIGQALGEDGLQHRSNTFAEPYYSLDQEDDVKYYLKNESADRGLYTSYVVPTTTGTLQWRSMTSAEAQQNDSTAWYITFTPNNQLYQLRNAATGQYLTYSGSFKTISRTTPASTDNFHLMPGRIDVGEGDNARRGYWIIRPNDSFTPNAMVANANGLIGSATFDIANSATRQRWLILTAEEMQQVEQASIAAIKKETNDALTNIKNLATVPHVELKAGTDQKLADAIAEIEQTLADNDIATLLSLSQATDDAAYEFLCNVSATDPDQPFDLTYRVQSAGIDSSDGWSDNPGISYSCGEFYERTFDFYQTITRLPSGDYILHAQGFQRPGNSETAYNDYTSGNNKVNAYLYAGSKSQKLAHIASDAQTQNLGGTSVGGKHIPNTMETASKYFAKGLYENSIETTIANNGSSLKIGIRCSSMPSYYWVIFDNFRLHFLGQPVPVAIADNLTDGTTEAKPTAIYDLQGRRVGTSLTPGLYIIGGKKVIVKQ